VFLFFYKRLYENKSFSPIITKHSHRSRHLNVHEISFQHINAHTIMIGIVNQSIQRIKSIEKCCGIDALMRYSD
jgi:hypothetical protein